jgi:hypothetical protein
MLFMTVPKNALVYLRKAEFPHIKAFFNGLLWNVANKNMVKKPF